MDSVDASQTPYNKLNMEDISLPANHPKNCPLSLSRDMES